MAAALIRGVALAPLASVPTARMGAPVVAPVVVVALAVLEISFALLLCFFTQLLPQQRGASLKTFLLNPIFLQVF
jgi:hypothetical protein